MNWLQPTSTEFNSFLTDLSVRNRKDTVNWGGKHLNLYRSHAHLLTQSPHIIMMSGWILNCWQQCNPSNSMSGCQQLHLPCTQYVDFVPLITDVLSASLWHILPLQTSLSRIWLRLDSTLATNHSQHGNSSDNVVSRHTQDLKPGTLFLIKSGI